MDINIQKLEKRYKRPLDLLLLAGAHVLLFPMWLIFWMIIPLLIWLEDRGPIFFVQQRVGWQGKYFRMYKFRTMRVPRAGEYWSEHTLTNDPRVTRVGRLLQRIALDELPQMINLWKGDISFVGPRPLPIPMFKADLEEEPSFIQRLQVRPGLTGLAQISLPRHCPPSLRLKYDLQYISAHSLVLDVKLILFSVWVTLTGRWGSGRREIESETNRIP